MYDFASDLIKEKKFDQYNAILNVREELERHKIIVDDLNDVLAESEKQLKSLQKQVKDLNKYKIAFTQLRTKMNETT